MPRPSLRYLALIGVLLAGVAGSHLVARRPLPIARSAEAARSVPRYAFHVDVAGWYQATADETVVYSSYDLSRQALPASLPLELGAWLGSDLGSAPDIERWFDGPDLVMRRQYADGEGRVVWLTAIGSAGPKSFRIFEHTPQTCYPSAEWVSLEHGVQRVSAPGGQVAVNRGLFGYQGWRRLVYYWYQWESPHRDAAQGVTSWRLTTDVRDGDIAAAEARLDGWLDLLFEEILPYHRF